MKKNNRRIIKLFESVPTFDTYSQYSVSLEKVFHENSLKNLLKNLKEDKKAKIFSYFDVEKRKNEPNKFNIFKHRRKTKKDNSKNNLLYDEGDNNIIIINYFVLKKLFILLKKILKYNIIKK